MQIRADGRWFAATLAIGVILVSAVLPAGADEAAYSKSATGTRVLRLDSGTEIKVLIERENLGGTEVDVATFSFPPGNRTGAGHLHGAIEIFYVVSGTLIHTVNGEEFVLTPGMAGVVRPGDSVSHGVAGDVPATGLIIWAPGGEAERLASSGNFKVEDLR